MEPYKNQIVSYETIETQDDGVRDADYSRALGSKKIGAHWVTLKPKEKSSYPHAESLEEEFIFVVSGNPHLWVNGFIYPLRPGDSVGFPAGTGIAHNVINNSSENVEMVVLGERTKPQNKCSFPVHPELKSERAGIWWDNPPLHELGPHNGEVGDLRFQKETSELSFIKNAFELPPRDSFSYPGDKETFTNGVRLTNHLGLKFLGLWYEDLKPNKRSSWPHAHKTEEEFAIVLSGELTVWLNGFAYKMRRGDCVYFPPGTNIAHTLMNESNKNVNYLGFGFAEDEEPDQVHYPLHPDRNKAIAGENFHWESRPEPPHFGPHPGHPIGWAKPSNALKK